jgi:signal transduction histidine kinase
LDGSPAAPFACPNCRAPISSDATVCRACGADIELMAMAAHQALLEPGPWMGAAPAAPVSPEQLVPRLGDYLVSNGYVTDAQLRTALNRQSGAPDGEQRRMIGHTLVDLGYLTPQALDRAIACRLLELQSSLLEANRNLERRVIERTAELRSALARLAEYNALKANFLANVSHELRTPLTHIKGYNHLLADGTLGPLTPGQEQALTTTNSAIVRLEQLISDLISYAAAARGELTLNPQPVSVPIMVLHAVQRSRGKAERQGVTLDMSLADDLPLALLDEEKVTWTLLQLLDNAIKFTPHGGAVSVTGHATERAVVVAVQDTGIGIPAGRINEIFEPFQQLDGSATRRYGGTGIGLALVRRILDAHGVPLQVESQEGAGSTFSLALPRLDVAQSGAPAALAP